MVFVCKIYHAEVGSNTRLFTATAGTRPQLLAFGLLTVLAERVLARQDHHW